MVNGRAKRIMQMDFARTLPKSDSSPPEWVTSKSPSARIYAADFDSNQHGYGDKDMRNSAALAVTLGLFTGFFGTSALFMTLFCG
jgi:hypothetical protein